MNLKTIDRWKKAGKQDPSIFNISSSTYETKTTWSPSTIKKFHSINTTNPTCQGILEQFDENNCFLCFKNNWNIYKSYNPQFNNWEYMCLLKMVWDGKLEVMISLHNGRRRLFFKTISGDGYFSKPKEETTRSKNE